MDSMFSSDKRLLVALPQNGFAQLVDLDVTVQFDGKLYSPIIRACLDGGVPAIVSSTGIANPLYVQAITTAYATAEKLVKDIGIPKGAIEPILASLENDFGPRLEMWLADTRSRICQPEPQLIPEATGTPVAQNTPTPAPLVPIDPNATIMTSVDRDVSPLFNEPPATCIMEYTLFAEPKLFRCLIALHNGDKVKLIDFQKKSVGEIIRHLNGDALPFEIAFWFGDSDSHKVFLISGVLKLSFAMNTGLAKEAANKAFIAEQIEAPGAADTVPVSTVTKESFMVFNAGGYFEVPETA